MLVFFTDCDIRISCFISHIKHHPDVGNCDRITPLSAACSGAHYAAEVLQTHGPADTLALLRQEPVDLVLINRKLDQDYSDGLDIIKSIKADPQLATLPCMIVSNYPDQQKIAVAAGTDTG